jgi:hypothetical protein
MSNGTEQNPNSISNLTKLVHKRNIEKGFCIHPVNIGESLMLVVSELSEALEADRSDKHSNISEKDKQVLSTLNNSEFRDKFDTRIKDTFKMKSLMPLSGYLVFLKT